MKVIVQMEEGKDFQLKGRSHRQFERQAVHYITNALNPPQLLLPGSSIVMEVKYKKVKKVKKK